MKSYTDLEQSKKLAEILPLESADMYYFTIIRDYPYSQGKIKTIAKIMDGSFSSDYDTPCWSLAALMHLLPSEFTEKGEYSETLYNIDIRKYALTDDVDIYQIAYGNYRWHEDGSHSWSDMINSGEREEVIDACYEMVLKINEQKLL